MWLTDEGDCEGALAPRILAVYTYRILLALRVVPDTGRA